MSLLAKILKSTPQGSANCDRQPPPAVAKKDLPADPAATPPISPPPPPTTPPTALALPCPTCGCPLYWTSTYDSADLAEPRCGECQPPPSKSLVGDWWFVILVSEAPGPTPDSPPIRTWGWEEHVWPETKPKAKASQRSTAGRFAHPGRSGAATGGKGAAGSVTRPIDDIPF